ncbi:MAG TPA: protein-glutamate O-methyltransferase CheR [Chthoniobacteraceae bacterium]|nr:protein-glutamate O-methyltransferase CheR [Chthoniobacteraceae bacterium]
MPSQAPVDDPFFRTLKHYIIRTTGLSYYRERDEDLAAAIVRALKGKPFESAKAYIARLSVPNSPHLDDLVEELTIGETFFFRHVEMFNALRDHVFPELARLKGNQRQLRIWSAGCSIGAEPYSLSILLKGELAHRFHGWEIEIIGTDINRRFLRMAREAVYERWALRGMSEEMRLRYFQPQERKWALKRRFVAGVTFQHHNLVRDRFPSMGNNLFAIDLVICRNVMIYFDRKTAGELAEQFHQSLVPGGWLALGHAEPHPETFRAFRPVHASGVTLYQRKTAGGPTRSREEVVDLLAPRRLPPLLPPPGAPPSWISIPEALARIAPPPSPAPAPLVTKAKTPPSLKEGAVTLESVRQMADQGDLAPALMSCQHLLREDQLNAAVHFFHGLILEQAGLSRVARNAFRRAIYLDRRLALAHYHLGSVHQRLRQPGRALRSFRNARAIVEAEQEEIPLPFGDGLTAGDLRNLIDLHLRHLTARPVPRPART